MKTAIDVLRHEHEAIVSALRVPAKMGRHDLAHDPIHVQNPWAVLNFPEEFADTCHHGKQEQWLFPTRMRADPVQATAIVQRLRLEHIQKKHGAVPNGRTTARHGSAGRAGTGLRKS